jgi:hypothetical protein
MKTITLFLALAAFALALSACGCSYTATCSLYIPMESDQQKDFIQHAQALIDTATQRGKLKDVFESEGLINKDRSLSILGHVKSLFFGAEQGEEPNVSEQYERERSRLRVTISKDSPNIIVRFSDSDWLIARNVADKVTQLVLDAESHGGVPLAEQSDEYRARWEVAKTYLANKQQEIEKLEALPEKDQATQAQLEALRAEEKDLVKACDDAKALYDATARHLAEWQAAHKEMKVMRDISPEPKH